MCQFWPGVEGRTTCIPENGIRAVSLMAEGLVKGRRVGRQNQWIADEKSEHDSATQARESMHSNDSY